MSGEKGHAGSQRQTFLRLIASLRPHWRRDPNLPARIQREFAKNKGFGSRDRRLYRELIYTTLRYLPWIEPLLDNDPEGATAAVAWLAADVPATRAFREALLQGWPPCPPSTAARHSELSRRLSGTGAEAIPLPAWFREHCPEAFEPPEVDALLARAPLWLRLQSADREAVLSEFESLGWDPELCPTLDKVLDVSGEANVASSEAYEHGLIEIQDLGSQMILHAAGVQPGGRWLDACAGAGGKTLQLAQLLGPGGHVDAHDIRPAALDELLMRAERAGIPFGMHRDSESASSAFASLATIAVPQGLYDGVLVDAPCSGSGTWRRAPHLKWSTTSAQIDAAAATQLKLLAHFAAFVRPGGRLIYATCSLSRRENEDVISGFLKAHANFTPTPLAKTFDFTPRGNGLTILPSRHNTDGFFVATLTRA